MGGYWDKSCTTVTQLKEGLNRILCLIPYNVISQPLWECFMPEWLEAIRTEVPDHQLKEFREVLRYECPPPSRLGPGGLGGGPRLEVEPEGWANGEGNAQVNVFLCLCTATLYCGSCRMYILLFNTVSLSLPWPPIG